ncbi:MAG: recombinase family protein [Candidatus Dormibacteria bacterium]|jgi:DNA invertase Pin-like site-specific DNA recombinase
MTRAALWLRVSTAEQASENQEPELRALAARRGWAVGPVYRVTASGWQGAHRAALGTVLRDARRGAFDVLLVWALDRLTREGTLRTLEIVRDFGRAGVPVVSCQEGWTEQAGPVQELLLAIAGWVAEQESARRSERTRAGLARARAEGRQLGRPPGSRDRQPRRRSGYVAREELAREVRSRGQTKGLAGGAPGALSPPEPEGGADK